VSPPNQQPRLLAFTTHHSRRVRVLQNQIHISEAFDPSTGGTQPERKPFVCIWDTGATNSVITKKVVDDLGLVATGKARVQGLGQGTTVNEFEVDTYTVNIFLPNHVALTGVPVSLGNIGGGDTDVLLGMDIITTGDFAITNHEDKTTLTFRIPSLKKIDFVEEINAAKPRANPLIAGQMQKGRDITRKERNRKRKLDRKKKKKQKKKQKNR